MGQLESDELLDDSDISVLGAGGDIAVAPFATIDPGALVDVVAAGFVDSVPVLSASSAWACSAAAIAASRDRLLLMLLLVCCWG